MNNIECDVETFLKNPSLNVSESCTTTNHNPPLALDPSKKPQLLVINNAQCSSRLPTIKISFKDVESNMLIDSGSSVSLLPYDFFNNIKHKINYRNLSRNVRIRTINSDLNFYSCVEISFKIQKKFFKHSFYLSDIHSKSFHGILGYDFITQFNVILLPHQNKCQINDLDVPLLDSLEYDSHVHTHHSFLLRKVVIKPNETVPIFLFSKDSVPNDEIRLFSLNNHPQLVSDDSLVCFKNSAFPVFVKNTSESEIHLNKGIQLGEITELEIDEINSSEEINLIQASKEILEKRKNDLSEKDFNLDHLSPQEKSELLPLLLSKSSAFSKSLYTLGHTDRIRPHLNFKNKNAIRALPFPIPFSLQKQVKDELQQMVKANLIEKTVSDWSCPMLLVKKKSDDANEQKFRLVLDLRLLNSVLNSSSYPLPKINTILQEIANYKLFSVFDFKAAYWQVNMPEEYRDILAFTTPFGTYKNNRLIFGLKSAASIFQSLADSIIDELKNKGITGVSAYQDDFNVGANSFSEMMIKIEAILDILSKNNLTLAPDKCVFAKSSIDYLGFHIENHTISPITSNIAKITKFSQPRNPKQVKRFVMMCSFYRNLIPDFAKLSQPLTVLTSKNTPFKWTSEHQKAFEEIQEVFFKIPFVQLPKWNEPFVLNTDASNSAISAILMQEYDGNLHPISYYSKALTPAQKRYPAIKQELFAIYQGVTAFKQYLYNNPFTILSDSKPLEFYRKTKSPADIVTRWLLELSEYTFKFKHIAGNQNVMADYWSRMPNPDFREKCIESDGTPVLPFVETVSPEEVNTLNVCQVQKSEILQAQLEDNEIKAIIQQIKDSSLKHCSKIKDFIIDEETELLMYLYKSQPKIVIPNTLKSKIISMCHSSHLGVAKTYELIQNRFFWLGMWTDTKNFVLSCEKCIKHKSYNPPNVPFGSTWIPKRPAEFISTDIVGPLANSEYVLTILDHFSKFLELYPLRKITTEAVTKHFFTYITTHGRPKLLLSDNGTQYKAEVFTGVSKALGIALSNTTVAHPASNGQSERVNSGIKAAILCLTEEGQSFYHALKIHQNLYNGTTHSSTGFTPNMLHFGRELPLIFDLFDDEVVPTHLDKSHYLARILTDLNNHYKKAYDNLIINQIKQNKLREAKSTNRSFKIGDTVYLRGHNNFKQKYSGPFSVISKESDLNYNIQLQGDQFAPIKRVHICRLRYAPPRKTYLFKDKNNQNDNNNQFSTHRYNLRNRT